MLKMLEFPDELAGTAEPIGQHKNAVARQTIRRQPLRVGRSAAVADSKWLDFWTTSRRLLRPPLIACGKGFPPKKKHWEKSLEPLQAISTRMSGKLWTQYR